jgi:class 3 adenylate cyclase
MGRFPVGERFLGIVLLMTWALTFSLSAHDAIRDAGISSVFLSTPTESDGYPEIYAFRLTAPKESTGLRIGDRLIQAGGRDLSGLSALAVFQTFYDVSPHSRHVPIVYQRDGVRNSATLELTSVRYAAPMLPLSFSLALIAALALFRAAPTPLVRRGVPALLVAALDLSTICVGSSAEMIIPLGLRPIVHGLTPPLLILAAMQFPDEPPASGWNRLWPWLFIFRVPFAQGAGFGVGVPVPLAHIGLGIFGVLFIGGMVAVLTRNFLRADPIGRRQVKWFIWSLYVSALPVIVLSSMIAVDPAFVPWAFISVGFLCIIPIGLVIGLYRYNWLDIDRLLSATASYNLLIFFVLAVGFLVIPQLAGVLSRSLDVDPNAGQLAVSVLLAAAVIPGHRRLRPRIERAFFPERHALDMGVERLQQELVKQIDAQTLTECFAKGLDRVFQPESCVFYAPSGDAWEVSFARGLSIPVAIEGDGPLIATLRKRHSPLGFGPGDARDTPAPDGFDRAVLETLDAKVVLPVHRGDSLELIICLGRKQSGDVYAATDLNLLNAVSALASAQLQRFDHARVEAQSRKMQHSLRRYVPSAVAETLARGRDLVPAEQEVTVLFADMRGYTAFSESREVSEIFAVVNRYTETVSEIVSRHHGSVVEFHGDGLMAVFGAPDPLESKERAAVAAGRAIYAEVNDLRGDDIGTQLTVGVGIATGSAFVGNIQTVDRMIWSAIGNTTNLAARLESLTRMLSAAVATDETTWRAVREVELGFQRHENVPIKGRRDCIDVYTLPLPTS